MVPGTQSKREKIYVRLKSSDDTVNVLFEFAIGKPEVFIDKSLQQMDFDYFCKVNNVKMLT